MVATARGEVIGAGPLQNSTSEFGRASEDEIGKNIEIQVRGRKGILNGLLNVESQAVPKERLIAKVLFGASEN